MIQNVMENSGYSLAYPAEYTSATDAAQVRGSEHRFTLLNWGTPVFWLHKDMPF
jgi:hypothetical protein